MTYNYLLLSTVTTTTTTTSKTTNKTTKDPPIAADILLESVLSRSFKDT